MKYIIYLFKKELNIYWKNIENIFISLIFFIFLALFFPFTITTDTKILSKIGLNLFWLAFVLIHITSQNSLYKEEHQLGILEQYFFMPYKLLSIIWLKNIIHWLSIILPILLLTPLIRIILNFTNINLTYLFIILVLTSYILHSISTFINMLTLVIDNNKNNLVGLLLIPLYIPITTLSLNYLEILHITLITHWLPQIIIIFAFCIILSLILPLFLKYVIKEII